ncbi:MAG: hypothetical protein RJA99_227 [Pseudomonadota bacterium]|jgi:hypothetical protein
MVARRPTAAIASRAARGAASIARIAPGIAVLAVLAAATAAAPAAAVERTLNEVWPEIDVYVRLDEHWRAMAFGAITRAADTGVSTETVFGVSLDYFPSELPPAWVRSFPGVEQYWGLMTRIGYNHVAASNPAGPGEERGVLEATVRSRPMWYDVVVSNRSRLDLRWIDGDFSWRGRNRTRIEQTWALPVFSAPSIPVGPVSRMFRSATPYLMAEFFWDSRYAQWSRQYYQVGVELETARNRSIEFFVARQYDVRVSGSQLTAAGITLSFRY